MKLNNFAYPLILAVALTGCATPEKPISREERLKNAHSSLFLYQKVADETQGNVRVFAGYKIDDDGQKKPLHLQKQLDLTQRLRVVHPADNTKVVALKTAAFLLSMVGGGVIAPGAGDFHTKDDLKGTRTEVQNQSIEYAYRPVRDYVFTHFGNHQGDKFFPLSVIGDRFYLVYDSYKGTKEQTRLYQLVQVITFQKIREDVGETKASFRQFVYHCKQNDAKYTMPEWSANNYQLLHQTAKRYAEQCAQEVLTKRKADFHAAYIR